MNGTTPGATKGRKSFKHAEVILQELSEDATFLNRMAPPWLSRIHGDLHFNNIMVDDRLARAVRFRWIDPKGIMTWGRLGYHDPAYDFGKLFQSTSGYYDLIHVGYLRASLNKPGFPRLVEKTEVEFKLPGGMSHAKLTTRLQYRYQPWTKEVFKRTATFIESVIRERKDYVEKDPDWRLRARFYEAAHMLAATPIHLRTDVDRAMAVFVRGVELLNEFYDRYRANQFPTPRRPRERTASAGCGL